MRSNTRTQADPDIPTNPEGWWRHPCYVHRQLIITGDLPADRAAARSQLAKWSELGVTHIVDVRGEWHDADLVSVCAPQIEYVWAGCDDSGQRRADAWFDAALAQLGEALVDPAAVVLVHCHMGVNRGPSMALRLLLEQGWDAVEALDAIRCTRPIAAVIYAADAVDHYHRAIGSPDTLRYAERRRVCAWLEANVVDLHWIIDRIRRAE